MFEHFHAEVVSWIRNHKQFRELKPARGQDIDALISNEILERGQKYCDTEFLGLLYAYRYAPMHYSAMRELLPARDQDAVIDFGGGPGTAMLAIAERTERKFDRLSLEHAEGMQKVARLAFDAAMGRCSHNDERQFPDARFWSAAEQLGRARSVLIVFSYFFAQELTQPFVRALAGRIAALPATSKTILYINPVGPSASWMPHNGIHDWYFEFARAMGHQPESRRNPTAITRFAILAIPWSGRETARSMSGSVLEPPLW